MLKKSLMLALIAAVGMFVGTAGAATATDTAALSVTVASWVSISFDAGSFSITYSGGGDTDSNQLTYDADGNANADITMSVTTVPTSSPGDWSFTGLVDDGTQASESLTAGTAIVDSVAVVRLSGADNDDTAATYTGGVATIDITTL